MSAPSHPRQPPNTGPTTGFASGNTTTSTTSGTTTTSNTTSSGKGDDAVHDVKNLAKGVHGLGESIRGNFNTAVDVVAGDKFGEVKNQAVADKGEAEMRVGEQTRQDIKR